MWNTKRFCNGPRLDSLWTCIIAREGTDVTMVILYRNRLSVGNLPGWRLDFFSLRTLVVAFLILDSKQFTRVLWKN